jgi:hypothetical protein
MYNIPVVQIKASCALDLSEDVGRIMLSIPLPHDRGRSRRRWEIIQQCNNRTCSVRVAKDYGVNQCVLVEPNYDNRFMTSLWIGAVVFTCGEKSIRVSLWQSSISVIGSKKILSSKTEAELLLRCATLDEVLETKRIEMKEESGLTKNFKLVRIGEC